MLSPVVRVCSVVRSAAKLVSCACLRLIIRMGVPWMKALALSPFRYPWTLFLTWSTLCVRCVCLVLRLTRFVSGTSRCSLLIIVIVVVGLLLCLLSWLIDLSCVRKCNVVLKRLMWW